MKRKPVYPLNWTEEMKRKYEAYLAFIEKAKEVSGWKERIVMQYDAKGESGTGFARRIFFANGFGVSLQVVTANIPTTFNIIFLTWHDDPREDKNWVVVNLADVTDGELTDIVFNAKTFELYTILDKVSEL